MTISPGFGAAVRFSERIIPPGSYGTVVILQSDAWLDLSKAQEPAIFFPDSDEAAPQMAQVE
jgi:hypothetical protein